MAASAGDAQRVAVKSTDMSKIQVVAVGEAARLEPLLAPLGTMRVVR